MADAETGKVTFPVQSRRFGTYDRLTFVSQIRTFMPDLALPNIQSSRGGREVAH